LTDSVRSRKFWLALGLGCLVAWMGNHFGAWYLTLVVGMFLGFLFARVRVALLATLLAGLTGWGGPLLWQSFTNPIGPAAAMTAGVMGLGSTHGYMVLVLTILIGVLLSLSGGWLGHSIRSLTRPASKRRMYT